MSAANEDLTALKARQQELKAQIAALGDMRPGFLVGRYRKCGKPNCHCARRDSEGHGPNWSLTRRVDGKTVTQVIPPGSSVERTKEHLAEYKRFRQLVGKLIEVSERLCSAQIKGFRRGPGETPEKRGSKKSSRPKSSRKSKRS